MTLESTRTLTEMSTKNLPGGIGRPTRGADLTAICELSRKCGSLDVSQPYGPSWSATRIAFFLITTSSILMASVDHHYNQCRIYGA
jgi:hypothetical protein